MSQEFADLCIKFEKWEEGEKCGDELSGHLYQLPGRGGNKTFKVCNMYTESVIRGAVPLAKPSANRKRGCSGDRERVEGGKKMKV